jgi:hypothetical protein
VTEHTIRLRGGWTCHAAGTALESPERRLTLPVRWGPDDTEPLILTRRFSRPRLLPDREALVLRMDQVGGILSLSLNGQSIAPISPTTCRYEIELGGLLERNELVLHVETRSRECEPAGISAEWGVISLVVRTVEPAVNP